MINRAQQILAGAACLLGIGHLIFGVVVFKTLNLEVLWFLGAGIAMIVTALANFRHDRIWVLRAQNFLMAGYCAILIVYLPAPQAWLCLFLFTNLFGISILKKT